ncbi:diphthamide biosynthesis protein 7, partial [Asbolus verrucosus]
MCEEGPPSKHITTLYTHKTEYNADSVEWCPHAPFQNLFVCANYQLKDSKDKCERIGRILLFSLTPEDGLKLVQTINTAAVLDQKWCHSQIGNRSILGVVNSENALEIYGLNSELVELELITRCQISGDEKETLLLSLDWATGKYPSDEPQVVCSDSKGAIHRFRLKDDQLVEQGRWHGHEFEAWITGFYYWDTNIFFSGGDDCRFLKFDQRVGPEPVSCNRSHEAGVTSLHSNLSKEYVLATGSYDTSVRLWDIRCMKSCTNSIKMPGTLWRLKWDPFDNNFLLAACMLGGVHIINSTNIEDLQIIDSYYKHKNIAYGADWSYLSPTSPDSVIIASCSFYDNLLCVSK